MIPDYLKDDLPVATLSNFWRETQRMKEMESANTLHPHILIPNLKNHKHLGGIIPYRLFLALLDFCNENSIGLQPFYQSARSLKSQLEDKKPVFENDRRIIFLTFEGKGKIPASMLVLVEPEIFAEFQSLYRGKKLDPYLRKRQAVPFHYPAETNISANIILRMHMLEAVSSPFARIAPHQEKSENGERRLKKIDRPLKSFFDETIHALEDRGNLVQIGYTNMRVEAVQTGRSTYHEDPDCPILFLDDARLVLRHAGKRPNSSVQIIPEHTSGPVDLITASNRQLKLRANETVIHLIAA